jgi:cytochrome c oxidase subunit 2
LEVFAMVPRRTTGYSACWAILCGLSVCELGGGRAVAAAQGSSSEPRVIEVVARRFEFAPATLEVAQGERVRIVVRSGDGLHGFGIKQFNISREVARGETVTIELTPKVAGEFPILCTEYCGDGHEMMKGTLVVVARETGTP